MISLGLIQLGMGLAAGWLKSTSSIRVVQDQRQIKTPTDALACEGFESTRGFRGRYYGTSRSGKPKGARASRTTFSSPTATTAVFAAGKYFFAAVSTSVAVVAATFFP